MTDRHSPRILLLGAALLLAACGQQASDRADDAKPQPAQAAGGATEQPVADTGLAAYAGKYPFDAVNGVAWNDHPAVKSGIAATVTDAKIRTTIETTAGPAAPIDERQGRMMAWACEAHNCGAHQWAVLIDPAGGATDVCYYDESVDTGRAHWFLAAGKEEWRDGNCQLGQDES